MLLLFDLRRENYFNWEEDWFLKMIFGRVGNQIKCLFLHLWSLIWSNRDLHVLKRSQFFSQWNPSKTSHQTEKSSRSGKMGLLVLSSQLGITRSRANDTRQLAKCTEFFVTQHAKCANWNGTSGWQKKSIRQLVLW